jgi:hypothetical protein
MRSYQPQDTLYCLTSRQVVFIGDSSTRELFYAFANILNPASPTTTPSDGARHQDVFLRTPSSTQITFYWDPYLNNTRTKQWMGLLEDTSDDGYPRRHTRPPAMIVLGSGLWYLRYSEGGIASWEANTESLLSIASNSTVVLADEVIFLPVPHIVESLLRPDRAETMRISDVEAMNLDLFHRVYPLASDSSSPNFVSSLPVGLPLALNEMTDPSETLDGLHYSAAVTRAQANLLLNLHCNKHLAKHPPFSTTCCTSYPRPGSLHLLVLVLIVFWGPVNWLRSSYDITGQRFLMEDTKSPLVLSGAAAIIYLADRSGLWLKEHKSFDPWQFAFYLILALAVGVAGTTKQSAQTEGFLNRVQTDEWKGWMQVLVLVYHYLDASRISGIYNPVRVAVASYLFMTGYGHTMYYYEKADYSFRRVAKILLRVNLLTLILTCTMNNSYLTYYFAPLVTMWFMVVFFTMYIGARYNRYLLFLIPKIVLSSLCVFGFMISDKPLTWIFSVLKTTGNIHWSAKEWAFRMRLDMFIVYVGMLSAIVSIQMRERKVTESPRWPLFTKLASVLAVLGLTWFAAFAYFQDSKFTYNKWHPYISFIPILSFVILRNSTSMLRATSSAAFEWIGKCSLETYIIQYHLWLAGDTKSILVILPGSRWRVLNFLLTTTIFLCTSKLVATATTRIVETLVGEDENTRQRGDPLLPKSGTGGDLAWLKHELSLPRPVAKTWRGRASGCALWVLDRITRIILDFVDWLASLDWKTYGVKARMGTIFFLLWALNLVWP